MDSFALLLKYKTALVACVAVVLVVLELLFPRARPLASAGLRTLGGKIWRWLRNIGLLLVNAGLSPLLVIPLSAWASSHALGWRPEWWSGWYGLLIDVLILDCWIYWWHRANHEIQFLWRFHEVHHLDEFLDVSSALRFHFGEVVLSALVRSAVIFVLDIPLLSVVVFETCVLIIAMFHHSNISLPNWLERFLSVLFVTPSIHWVHHHAIRRDTDSNYASILSVWDLAFGSRSATRRWVEMPIGVENRHDEGFTRLLAKPFRVRRKRV
jgi:sterol desaturase/sphingolipid hydroxylase (fatty acid hydroxylase superfamily)